MKLTKLKVQRWCGTYTQWNVTQPPAMKKKWNCAICRDVDGPRDGHTEWISQKKKEVLYLNAYMWNLEKWYRWTYLQSWKRYTDLENKHMDTKGGHVGRDALGDWDWHTYAAMYKIDHEWEPTAQRRKPCLVLCGDLDRKEIQKRGDVCMCIADSLCCTVENNTTLYNHYTPIKI